MTNYFCFDVGNVLCDVDFTDFLRELTEATGADHDDVWFFLNRIQPLQDLGYVTMQNELRHCYKIKLEENSKIQEAWNNSVHPNPISMKHFEEIVGNPHKNQVSILSNIGTEHLALLGSRLGSKYNWCKMHMSCEIGHRKPSKMYYRSFLAEHPEFNSAEYVDDRQENLDMGHECGLRPNYLDTSKMTSDEVDSFWYDLKKRVIYQP